MAMEAGYILKKSVIFFTCGSISTIMCILFFVFVVCTSQMHGAISELCGRFDNSFDLQCKIKALDGAIQRSVCDRTCAHDYSDALGGSGGAPGLFGVGDWKDDEKQGYPQLKDDDEENWKSLVRPGNSCLLSPAPANSGFGAQVDCSCEETPVQIMLQMANGEVQVEGGCTVTSWEDGTPWVPVGEVSIPCLYIPKSGKLRNEIAVGAERDKEIERCSFAQGRFSNGGHYFVIYVPIMILWCWCGLISCVGYADQKYQAFNRFKGKGKGVDKLGDPMEDSSSAAVSAAQEWAQQQQAMEGNLYGNPEEQRNQA